MRPTSRRQVEASRRCRPTRLMVRRGTLLTVLAAIGMSLSACGGGSTKASAGGSATSTSTTDLGHSSGTGIPSSAAGAPAACDLLTGDELSTAIGEVLPSTGKADGVGCDFTGSAAFARVNVQPTSATGKSYFAALAREQRAQTKLHIGTADAVYFPPRSGSELVSETLAVFDGTTEFDISDARFSTTQVAHKNALISLAETALGRVQR